MDEIGVVDGIDEMRGLDGIDEMCGMRGMYEVYRMCLRSVWMNVVGCVEFMEYMEWVVMTGIAGTC